MPTADLRWASTFDRLAALLAATGAILRLGVSGGSSGTGLNLFIHLLPWLALGAWFAARACAGGGTWRYSGFEFAVLGLAVAELLSTALAPFKLPALEQSFGHLSYGLFLLVAVQVLGRGGVLSIFSPALPALSVYALVQYFLLFPALLEQAQSGRFGSIGEELVRRIGTREVFASFIGPNQFAGFLALSLPLALGRLLDARPLGLRGMAPHAAGLALGAVAIALTGSLGGWVALACGTAAFAGLALTRERGRTAVVAAGALLTALAVLLVVFTPLLERLGTHSHSLHVRRVYWTAAARVAAERPVVGTGPGNFQDEFTRLKPETPQEATQVHNDYLQALAETGALGLLALAGLLGLGLRRALPREAGSGPDAPPLPSWLVPAGASIAFLLLVVRSGADSAVLLAGAVWIAGAFLPAGPGGAFTRIGGAAGLLALLVHMTVDFLFTEPGAALALFAVLALLELLRERPAAVTLTATACAAGTAVLLGIALPGLWLTGRALAADRELQTAREALVSPGGAAAAAALAESAAAHNPWQPEARVLYARAQMKQAAGAPERAEAALEALEGAIRLRPSHSPYRTDQARVLLQLYRARQDRTLPRAHLDLARGAQEKATALYPSMAWNRYALARILDLSGETERARTEYAEALRLSVLASRELENLSRLQLGPIEKARALVRLGRPEDARAAIAPILLRDSEGDPRALLQEIRRRPELLMLPEGEIDETTRPVIEAAVDAALRGLPR